MINDELQAAIAANTQAINYLVTQFIRPSAQQQQQSDERLSRIEELLERQAEVITGIDLRLETIAQQQQVNTKQIAANAEVIARFDSRLEGTRQLVAQNSADIAQLTVKQNRNGELIESLAVKQDRNSDLIGRNGTQIEALAETSRTQLAAIIGNGRRLDRLEQQAS
ncbi:MAG: hypothetical protein AAGJ80_16065 [Cyanobacteria bacterium J06553_1]